MNTILITGANKGIGFEMVKQYLVDGWHVLACCRSLAKAAALQSLKKEREQLDIFQLDVSDPSSIKALANQIGKDTQIDILMNNAGLWGPTQQHFGSTDPLAWLEVFKVNTMAPQLLAEALIQQIAKSQLKMIVNMVSTMASITENTLGGCAIYRSTKTALGSVSKSMALDLNGQNITVIALHPGWVKTDMGGPDAKITTEESVRGIKTVLSHLSIKDSGTYIGYNGDKLVW